MLISVEKCFALSVKAIKQLDEDLEITRWESPAAFLAAELKKSPLFEGVTIEPAMEHHIIRVMVLDENGALIGESVEGYRAYTLICDALRETCFGVKYETKHRGGSPMTWWQKGNATPTSLWVVVDEWSF